ncbi:MAG: hypothetical protein GY866_15845 [Proteobacteria bacterium]|nr:hypothetical protein [Pseudomonadota bacterium]
MIKIERVLIPIFLISVLFGCALHRVDIVSEREPHIEITPKIVVERQKDIRWKDYHLPVVRARYCILQDFEADVPQRLENNQTSIMGAIRGDKVRKISCLPRIRKEAHVVNEFFGKYIGHTSMEGELNKGFWTRMKPAYNRRFEHRPDGVGYNLPLKPGEYILEISASVTHAHKTKTKTVTRTGGGHTTCNDYTDAAGYRRRNCNTSATYQYSEVVSQKDNKYCRRRWVLRGDGGEVFQPALVVRMSFNNDPEGKPQVSDCVGGGTPKQWF